MKLWIARDKNTCLAFYNVKPKCPNPEERGEWYASDNYFHSLDASWFPEVTFENSPQQVEIKLVK